MNINQEKVSIIIPVYNGEKFLKECLESVCRQTYSHLEIIVVNDGSKDYSDNIIKEYLKIDPRIIYFSNENHGVSYTRNFAMEKSTGTYVVPIDADDIVADDYVEILVNGLEKYQVDLVATSLVKKNSFEQSCFTTGRYRQIGKTDTINSLWGEIGGYACGKIYRKQIIDQGKLKYNESLAISEDLMFNIEYLLLSRDAVYYDGNKYFYRQISNSAIYDLNNRKWFSVIKTYEQILKILSESQAYDTAANAYLMLLPEAKYRAKRIKDPKFIEKVNVEFIKMKKQLKMLTFKQKIKYYLSLWFPNIVMAYHRRKL